VETIPVTKLLVDFDLIIDRNPGVFIDKHINVIVAILYVHVPWKVNDCYRNYMLLQMVLLIYQNQSDRIDFIS